MAELSIRLLKLVLVIIAELAVAGNGYHHHHHHYHDEVYMSSGTGRERGRSLNIHQQQRHDYYHTERIQAFKASLRAGNANQFKDSLISPSPHFTAPSVVSNPRVYHVTTYGADPTGKSDSTEALLKAFSDAASNRPDGDDTLIAGIINIGGAQINLDGGIYLISRPLRFPVTGVGNIVIQGGSLKASDSFPTDRYLIELSSPPTSSSSSSSSSSTTKNKNKNNDDVVKQEQGQGHERQEEENPTSKSDEYSSYNNLLSSSSPYLYEYITFRDLYLDCSYISNGVNVADSLRTGIDNLFVSHFSSYGIHVQSGHETLIRDTYLGQHITAGGDAHERNFSGTAIALMGNDNVLSNVIIFSAQTGVLVGGQANLLTGVHCYNKAAGFGGTGIYLQLPGLTQTRIVDSYLDYTGIVAEDPVQLVVANNFFLGDAGVTLKAVDGVASGVVIVDNIFSGSGKGVDTVTLDLENKKTGGFDRVQDVVVERNSARGMNLKATVARARLDGNGPRWEADFTRVLLFPDRIGHVQFSPMVVITNNTNTSTSTGSSNRTRPNGTGTGTGTAMVEGQFPKATYLLRNVSDNRVVIESDVQVPTSIYVMVDQGGFGSSN